MDRYIIKGRKKLRYGYTTGSCAAAAAKAAALMLLSGQPMDTVTLPTPKEWDLNLSVQDIRICGDRASCAVQKDSGDDPDVTNGILIYALVKKRDRGIEISGGKGIGTVTRNGLNLPVGDAAINKTPREMIKDAVTSVAEQFEYNGGFDVEIYVPEGERIAKKTFNERLGITGGISILGTTGIVEPMSEEALIASLKIEMDVLAGKGCKRALFCPGNYGWKFAKETLKLDMDYGIKISNFIGDMLDHALGLGFRELLLVAHIGKAVKIAGGIMNTHSKFADCRAEIMAAHALKCGGDADKAREILDCVSTDAMATVLQNCGLLDCVIKSILYDIESHMAKRLFDEINAGAVLFSHELGLLGMGDTALEIIGGFGYAHS